MVRLIPVLLLLASPALAQSAPILAGVEISPSTVAADTPAGPGSLPSRPGRSLFPPPVSKSKPEKWRDVAFYTGVAAYTFGSIRDTRSTKAADARLGGAYELNPLLRLDGSARPDATKIIVGKAVVGGASVLAYYLLPKRWRFLPVVTLWTGGAAGEFAKRHNDSKFR